MNKTIPLSEIKKDKSYIIHAYEDPQSDYSRKLITMGFIEGTRVQKNESTIPDPIVINLRNVRIALRKKEAAQVLVIEE